jgi:hypothetical protein
LAVLLLAGRPLSIAEVRVLWCEWSAGDTP